MFSKVFDVENNLEIVKTRKYNAYVDKFQVSQNKIVTSPNSLALCCNNQNSDIKNFARSAQVETNSEMESKIKEIKSFF